MNKEEVEYEYVELLDGEEYLEEDGYEYEYVEDEYEEAVEVDSSNVADLPYTESNAGVSDQLIEPYSEPAEHQAPFVDDANDVDLNIANNDSHIEKSAVIEKTDELEFDLDLDLDSLLSLGDESFLSEDSLHSFSSDLSEEIVVEKKIPEQKPFEHTKKIIDAPVAKVEAVLISKPNEFENPVNVIENVVNPPLVESSIVKNEQNINLSSEGSSFVVKDLDVSGKAFLVDVNSSYQKVNGNIYNYTIILKGLCEEELFDWKLIVFKKQLFNLSDSLDDVSIDRNEELTRYLSLVKNGEQKINIFEKDNIKLSRPTKKFALVDGSVLLGDSSSSALLVDDYIVIGLDKYINKQINFSESSSGMLVGKNGSVIFFYNISKINIAANEATDLKEVNHLSWYSGSAEAKHFSYSRDSNGISFIGSEMLNSIHLDIGNTSYGWNVFFDSGVVMGITDLIEYQIKNSSLPSNNGRIVNGDKKLDFTSVEKIVVYKSSQYFTYNI